MRPVRRGITAAARRLGYGIAKVETSNAVQSQFDERRIRLLHRLGIDVVLDIGANVGQYAAGLRKGGYSGRILSAEPLTSAFERLQIAAEHDPLWDCARVALGPHRGTTVLNISGYSESSSVLPMKDDHIEALPQSAYVGSESVPMTTLDDLTEPVLTESSKAWLKLDVQGFEASVLAGADDCLPKLDGIECELSLVELYTGQALLSEVIELLASRSFRPVWMDPAFIDPATGDALQLNGLFVRTDRG